MHHRLAFLMLVGLVGCSNGSPVGPVVEHPLNAAVTSGGLTLTNSTDTPLYYQAFEKVWGTDGLFTWAACTRPATCPSVPAHGATSVPYTSIDGYTTDARQALVYYWELAPAAGAEHQVRNLRSTVVNF
ncbi:MAG: hypothetical protein V4558_09340 [Gemmatimonadota bacterium]